MIPEDKRGTYSAVNTIGFNFSELLARLGIVLGTIFFFSNEYIYAYNFISWWISYIYFDF